MDPSEIADLFGADNETKRPPPAPPGRAQTPAAFAVIVAQMEARANELEMAGTDGYECTL
jgi:hypothetical protein